MLSTACLASLGGYGWWSTSTETSPALPSGAICTAASCRTVDGTILEHQLDAEGDVRHTRHGKPNEIPLPQKVLLLILLFSLEAGFLYAAMSHLKIPRHRHWQSSKLGRGTKRSPAVRRGNVKTPISASPVPHSGDCFLADPEAAESDEELSADLANVEPSLQPEDKDAAWDTAEDLATLQPTLQPECKDIDARLPEYGDLKDLCERTQQPLQLPGKLAEKEEAKETDEILKAASPLRRRRGWFGLGAQRRVL